MAPSPHSKKRKAAAAPAAAEKDSNVVSKTSSKIVVEKKKSTHSRNVTDRKELHAEIDYAAYSLQEIHDRFQDLCRNVPAVPDDGFLLTDKQLTAAKKENASQKKNSTMPVSQEACVYDKATIRIWAADLQNVLQEFRLLVACSSPATYVWGTDRSGAAEQNLALLSNEFSRSQEHISARVTPHLNDVLAPVVTLVTDKTVTIKHDNGKEETKQNYFITTEEDPDYVDLCYSVLAKNAVLLRQVVLSNFDKLLQAVEDYLAAQHKDSQHDARGFVY
jgi:hypothetical protein